jgi:hypothetical protein
MCTINIEAVIMDLYDEKVFLEDIGSIDKPVLALVNPDHITDHATIVMVANAVPHIGLRATLLDLWTQSVEWHKLRLSSNPDHDRVVLASTHRAISRLLEAAQFPHIKARDHKLLLHHVWECGALPEDVFEEYHEACRPCTDPSPYWKTTMPRVSVPKRSRVEVEGGPIHSKRVRTVDAQQPVLQRARSEPVNAQRVSVPVESPSVVVKSESPAVVVKSESPAVVVKSESPAVVVKSESPAVVVKSESPAVVVKSESPAVVVV